MAEEERFRPGKTGVFVIRGAAGLLFWKSEGTLGGARTLRGRETLRVREATWRADRGIGIGIVE